MTYYELNEKALRKHLGAFKICFKVDNRGILVESVIIGRNIKVPWAIIEECQQRFDKSECNCITEKEYKSHYEDANYIISN